MISRIRVATLTATLAALVAVVSSCSSDPQKAKQSYLQSGTRYLGQGKNEQAIIQFQNALKLDPRFTEAFYQLSKAYLATHDAQRAFSSLQQAIILEPNRLDLHLAIGQVYLGGGSPSKAEEEANFVIARDPGNGFAYQLLGTALAAQQQTQKAVDALTKAVELQPRDPSAVSDLGLAEMTLKRYDAAEQHLSRAVELDPHSIRAYGNLANLYRLLGRMDDAILTFHLGATNNPDVPSLGLSWADLLYSSGKQSEAAAALDQIRGRNPKSAKVAQLIGDFYATHRDPDKAVAEYQRALQLERNDAEIQNHLVDTYLAAGRLKEAAEANDRVRSQFPKDIFARTARGRILLARGNRDEAIAELQQVLKQGGDLAQTHYVLGVTYWQNGNLPQAKTELLDAARMAPDSHFIKRSLTELHLALGEAKEALELARRLVDTNPSDAGFRVLLGRVLLAQGEPTQANAQFLEARKSAPGSLEIALALAQGYVNQRKWTEAEKELEACLKSNPRSVEAIESLANVWVAQKNSAKAISRVEGYLGQNPSDAAANVVLGKLYQNESRLDAAKSAYSRAVQLKPEAADARALLGGLYQQEGNLDAAIREFETVLNSQPKSAFLHTLVADLYSKRNNGAMAKKHYEQAIAIDPNFVAALNNLAWMYASQGVNLDVALGLAQKAKELQPDSLIAADTLGWIQYKKGLFEPAIPLLEECVAKAPKTAVYHYHLGAALAARGDKRKGKEQIETALRLNLAEPDAQAAKALFAGLK